MTHSWVVAHGEYEWDDDTFVPDGKRVRFFAARGEVLPFILALEAMSGDRPAKRTYEAGSLVENLQMSPLDTDGELPLAKQAAGDHGAPAMFVGHDESLPDSIAFCTNPGNRCLASYRALAARGEQGKATHDKSCLGLLNRLPKDVDTVWVIACSHERGDTNIRYTGDFGGDTSYRDSSLGLVGKLVGEMRSGRAGQAIEYMETLPPRRRADLRVGGPGVRRAQNEAWRKVQDLDVAEGGWHVDFPQERVPQRFEDCWAGGPWADVFWRWYQAVWAPQWGGGGGALTLYNLLCMDGTDPAVCAPRVLEYCWSCSGTELQVDEATLTLMSNTANRWQTLAHMAENAMNDSTAFPELLEFLGDEWRESGWIAPERVDGEIVSRLRQQHLVVQQQQQLAWYSVYIRSSGGGEELVTLLSFCEQVTDLDIYPVACRLKDAQSDELGAALDDFDAAVTRIPDQYRGSLNQLREIGQERHADSARRYNHDIIAECLGKLKSDTLAALNHCYASFLTDVQEAPERAAEEERRTVEELRQAHLASALDESSDSEDDTRSDGGPLDEETDDEFVGGEAGGRTDYVRDDAGEGYDSDGYDSETYTSDTDSYESNSDSDSDDRW